MLVTGGSDGQASFAKVIEHTPEVAIYSTGVMLQAGGVHIGNPDGKGGGKRGAVIGWSTASRRRMRQALLTLGAPEGWRVGGLSCTIPPPSMTPEAARALWADFSLRMVKAGMGMIWRMEVQRRGALHWHALVIGEHPGDAVILWHDALRRAGPVTFDPPYRGSDPERPWKIAVSSAASRMGVPGAAEHAGQLTVDDYSGAWLRYLQDHASKAKQEQIGVGMGRHWGVVGRKFFAQILPAEVCELTPSQYARVRRAYERLATARIRDDRALFGRRAGYPVRRGRRGRAVCFCKPETVKRMIEWAKGDA